jgi:hypothetical protein
MLSTYFESRQSRDNLRSMRRLFDRAKWHEVLREKQKGNGTSVNGQNGDGNSSPPITAQSVKKESKYDLNIWYHPPEDIKAIVE